jgi:hypothetical protein
MYISVLRTIYYERHVFKQTYMHFKTLLHNYRCAMRHIFLFIVLDFVYHKQYFHID